MTLIPDGTSSRLNLYVFSIFNHNRIPDCHAIAAYDFDISIAAAGDVSSAVNRIRTISFSAHIFNRDTPGTVHSQVCCDISAYHIACSGIFHQDVTGAGNSSFAINESAGRCTRYFHILCAGNGQAAIYHSTVRIAQYHIHLILEIVSDLDLHLAKAAGTGQGVGIRVIGELVVSDSKNVPAVFAGHFNGRIIAYRDFDAVVGCLISDLLPFSGQGRVFVHSNSDIFAGLAASLPASEFPPRDIIRRFGNDIHLSAFGNRINTSFVLVCFHRMVFVGISLGIRQGKGVLDSGIFRRSGLDVQILCIHRCRVSRTRQRSLSIAAFTFTNCHTVSTCGICAGEHDLAHSAAVILHGQGLGFDHGRIVGCSVEPCQSVAAAFDFNVSGRFSNPDVAFCDCAGRIRQCNIALAVNRKITRNDESAVIAGHCNILCITIYQNAFGCAGSTARDLAARVFNHHITIAVKAGVSPDRRTAATVCHNGNVLGTSGLRRESDRQSRTYCAIAIAVQLNAILFRFCTGQIDKRLLTLGK